MAKDIVSVASETLEASGLEIPDDHEKTINGVVLVPQPSASLDDPLV